MQLKFNFTVKAESYGCSSETQKKKNSTSDTTGRFLSLNDHIIIRFCTQLDIKEINELQSQMSIYGLDYYNYTAPSKGSSAVYYLCSEHMRLYVYTALSGGGGAQNVGNVG